MIRVTLVLLVTAFLGLLTNATLVHSTSPFAVAPDFILVLAVILGFYQQNVTGVIGAFMLGLLADFGSAQWLGPNAAGCIVAFRLVGLIANRVYAEKALAVFIIVFICSVAKSAAYLALVFLYSPAAVEGDDVLRLLMYEALVSGLVGPVVIWAVRGQLFPMGSTRAQATTSARWVT